MDEPFRVDKPTNDKKVIVYFDDETHARLEQLKAESGATMSWIVRRAVEYALGNMEQDHA